MSIFRHFASVVRLLLLPLALYSGIACGQDAAELVGSGALEEIIVTARRREEPLQHVPIAVTVLSGQQLDDKRITGLGGIQYAAPTLVIWPVVGNSITATMSLRGLVEPDLLPTNDATVGIYLDGVYIARTTGANIMLIDMQRVEVLRGPQGTLFGRNTIGGAINLISNKPGPETGGSLSAVVGAHSLAEITGLVNAPVDAIGSAVRISARHTQHDGYGRAVALDQDLSDDATDFIRAQIEVGPGPTWTLDLAGDLTNVHTASQLITFLAAFPPDAVRIPAAAGNPDDTLDNYAGVTDGHVLSNRVGKFDARVRGLAATLTGEFAAVTITSISAYRDLSADVGNTDLDGTPYDIGAVLRRSNSERQFSQELQLRHGLIGEPLAWTAGVHYFSETAALLGHNIALVPLFDAESITNGTAHNDAWSAYVHSIWQLTRSVRLTAGLRYNADRRQLTSENAVVSGGIESCRLDDSLLDSPGICRATLPIRNYNYLPALLGIDVLPNADVMFYGKISRGYRAGGYNMRGGTPTELLAFGPEEVISYEIGTKTDLLGKRLRANLAVYDAEYRDIQLGVGVPSPTGVVFIKQNGGRGRIRGGELEVTGLLGQLRLSGSAGIVQGKFVELDSSVTSATANTPLGLPKVTYMFGADLSRQFRHGGVFYHVDYSWRSSDADDTFEVRCKCDNAYGLLTVSVAIELERPELTLQLWARNATNRFYMANWVDFDDYLDAIPGDPATYGLSIRYDFGRAERHSPHH